MIKVSDWMGKIYIFELFDQFILNKTIDKKNN